MDQAAAKRKKACNEYLDARTSTYEFRCLRYYAVLTRLWRMGMIHSDSVMDLGAGRQDFCRYLREVYKWKGIYVPVDGSIDGTDLNTWEPSIMADWVVGIEVAEHLSDPYGFLEKCMRAAKRGVVFTTPNPLKVDVFACDPTHISEVRDLERLGPGWTFSYESLFGIPEDTLIGRYWRVLR
jgi:hypothetical protein